MPSPYINLSKDNEWYTPKYIVDYFGKFDYDPATNIEKANEFNIKNYDTKDTNGLLKDWTIYKRIWINPPFTLKNEFLQKAQDTYDKAKNEIYIVLPISFLTTKSFHRIIKGCIFYIPDGRIKFEKNNNFSSPPLGTIIIKLSNMYEVKLIKIEDMEEKK